jgi:LysM repeat protein
MHYIKLILPLASMAWALPTPQNGPAIPYTVQSGDTGYHIAGQYTLPFSVLSSANPGVDWNNLQVGQTLQLPTSWNGRDGNFYSPNTIQPI